MSFRPLVAGPSRNSAVAIQTPLKTARRSLIVPHPGLKREQGQTDRFRLMLPVRDHVDMVDVFTYLRAAEKALGSTIIAVEANRDIDSRSIMPYVQVTTIRPVSFKGPLTVRVKAREEPRDNYGGPSLASVERAIQMAPQEVRDDEVGRDLTIIKDDRPSIRRRPDTPLGEIFRPSKQKKAGSFERVLDVLNDIGGEWSEIAQKYNHLRRPERPTSPRTSQGHYSAESMSADRISAAIKRGERSADAEDAKDVDQHDRAIGASEEVVHEEQNIPNNRRHQKARKQQLLENQRKERAREYKNFEKLAGTVTFTDTPIAQAKPEIIAPEATEQIDTGLRFKVPVHEHAKPVQKSAEEKPVEESHTPEQARQLEREKKAALASVRRLLQEKKQTRTPSHSSSRATGLHAEVVPGEEEALPTPHSGLDLTGDEDISHFTETPTASRGESLKARLKREMVEREMAKEANRDKEPAAGQPKLPETPKQATQEAQSSSAEECSPVDESRRVDEHAEEVKEEVRKSEEKNKSWWPF